MKFMSNKIRSIIDHINVDSIQIEKEMKIKIKVIII
jgi:hypothetical protein